MKIVKAYPFTNAFGETLIKAITEEGYTAFIPNAESDVSMWKEFLAGGGVIDEDYVEPVEPPPVPETISDRQFFQQIATMGLVTQQEALTYLGTGVLPAAFESFVMSLPSNKQFDARMKLMANSFNRSDELVGEFATLQGMSAEQVDAIWLAASQL